MCYLSVHVETLEVADANENKMVTHSALKVVALCMDSVYAKNRPPFVRKQLKSSLEFLQTTFWAMMTLNGSVVVNGC